MMISILIGSLGYVLPAVYLILLFIFTDDRDIFLFFNLVLVPVSIIKITLTGMSPLQHSLSSLFLIYVLSHTMTTNKVMNFVGYVFATFTLLGTLYVFFHGL